MEMTVEQKIRYADIVTRVMVFASVLFIGFGSVIRISQDAALGNMIMFTGLIFVALLGVAAYTKKKLQQSVDDNRPFVKV